MTSPEAALVRLTELLSGHSALVNSCSVDFIVKDLYCSTLSPALQAELAGMDEREVAGLPGLLVGGAGGPGGEVGRLVGRLRDNSLESLGLVREEVELGAASSSLLDHFDKIMPAKKTHEVRSMFRLVTAGVRAAGCSAVLDLGSGKGYLSHALAALADLPVLAVDGKADNSRGAERREDNLAGRWRGLTARAEQRSEGRTVGNRRRRRLARRAAEGAEGGEGPAEEGTAVVNLTQMVEAGSDCSGLVTEHLGPGHARFGLVGLHTCGDLAATSLRALAASPGAAFLCNVGCCYHHLTERFYSHPFLPEQTARGPEAGFPLSAALVSRGAWLGRSARMLASQPLSRLAAAPALPTSSLLWRAVLQVLLARLAPHLSGMELQVGRLASKAKDFPDYARRAFSALGADLAGTTDPELAACYAEQAERHGARLAAFHQLRALFAPLVENIVILDRLCFLREQASLADCYIVRLFDPAISPRAYALVASRP